MILLSLKTGKDEKQKKKELSKSQQLAKANFRSCPGGVCKTGNCSFHGDTLVKTENGFEPIKN